MLLADWLMTNEINVSLDSIASLDQFGCSPGLQPLEMGWTRTWANGPGCHEDEPWALWVS
jgi:hypothetical protein